MGVCQSHHCTPPR